MPSKAINIINVPSDIGSIYAGKSRAPAAFKTAGLHAKLEHAGLQVTETEALPDGSATWVTSSREPNGARNERQTVEACHSLARAVATALAEDAAKSADAFQLILGGECLYCPPIMSAYFHHLHDTGKNVGIIYVDADCDLATAADTNGTGNIAGMTLTHLTLRDGALESMKAFARPGGAAVVDSSNIVLFGLNMNSPANQRTHLGYLLDNGFKVVTADTVQKEPLEAARKALAWMESRVDVILVHLDVDVIDPGTFPLGNVPSWTGIGFGETMAAVQTFLGSRKTAGLSIAEVNPDHDPGLAMTTRLVDEVVQGLKSRAKD